MTDDTANTDAVSESRAEHVMIRRTVDAPRERVWRAFTDPDEVRWWYGSDMMDVEIHALEAEPGGSFSITMRDGEDDYDMEGEFLEVIERERLVHTWYVGRVTVAFDEVGEGTEVVLTHEGLPDRETTEQHAEGWTAAIETLAAIVRNDEDRER
ncbi:SRPBCC family protein [Natronorubrum daqingense]|uniref:Uncharacterized conserved protein YndB, AHSA1/START domain n=1 Tax=Natronorubrum daqingense TaxID=588898 RepID=A0A1N7EM62_9EURY|nr:SRPBCC family protein [Natronorubrum daqingense]APX97863.1 hypothetical protein BB347_15255 [Natronorubrum daqingense]SIR89139.1 Uncharacterized conserved protein YndB, AHSA1/START domain [Natronorubrum daqingense]